METQSSAVFAGVIQDLKGLGRADLATYFLQQLWGGFPDAQEVPDPEVPLTIDGSVVLAEIVFEMTGPENPHSAHFLDCIVAARTLIRSGYPQMGQLLIADGIQAFQKLTAADLVNYNIEVHGRADAVVAALRQTFAEAIGQDDRVAKPPRKAAGR